MNYGFIKVAAASPHVTVADVDANAVAIRALIDQADAANVNLLVLPELCLTGYTCGDLFYSETLLNAAQNALLEIAAYTSGMKSVVVVGVPLAINGKIYSCAAVLHDGAVIGLIPKTHPAADQRQFSPAPSQTLFVDFGNGHLPTPLDAHLSFQCDTLTDFRFGVELGEDLWAADPPSRQLCQASATIIVNPSASAEFVARKSYRRMLVESTSARLICGYVLANADCGESVQDMVYSQHNLIAENGTILAENPPFGKTSMIVSEIDVCHLSADRRKNVVYQSLPCENEKVIIFHQSIRSTDLTRKISKTPFILENTDEMNERAEEILRIQSTALMRRIEHTHAKTAVIGISGGLDSCLTLLVAARTMDMLNRDRKDIVAISMPCFGTTTRTRGNAEKMCELLGVTFREINIAASVRQHFTDLGHDESVHDVTFENSQARERTQLLMDTANQCGGIVVGTGDLSELALGWATYNGDHMSMYGVNASIPKTLVRRLVRYEAEKSHSELAEVLFDILDTPVSPELLPASTNGDIQQKTEDLVGPYELHDFFLYYALRFGDSPKKIFHLAHHVFHESYSDEIILKWLRTFFRRFFMQQFKRSCLPDGPKVGSVSLSPRGDWMMPSDAISALWLKEIDSIKIQ